MAAGDVETYFASGAWHHRIVGRGELPGTHASRQDAVRAGSEIAVARHAHHQVWYAGGHHDRGPAGGGRDPGASDADPGEAG